MSLAIGAMQKKESDIGGVGWVRHKVLYTRYLAVVPGIWSTLNGTFVLCTNRLRKWS